MALIARLTALALALLVVAPAAASPGRAAFLQSVVVDEPVAGDVVAVGGDVVLGPHARVSGHVVAVFGEVRAHELARVDGRALSVASVASLQMVDAHGSNVLATVGARLFTAGAWLLVTSLLAALLPAWLRRASWMMPQLGVRIAAMGVLGVVTLVAALVAVLAVGGAIGIAAATLLMLLFLAAKALGLAVLGAALGAGLVDRAAGRVAPVPIATAAGVAAMLLVRFVPLVGELAWSLLSIVALGAGLLAVLVTSWDTRLATAFARPAP